MEKSHMSAGTERRKGAPKGNQNARKHGFYSRVLDEAEQLDFDLATGVEGKEIITIEGISVNRGLHPLQEAFVKYHASQCGFCSPGMILTAKAFLDRNPNPSEVEVRDVMMSNLCRCTGYEKIIEAIMAVANEEVA